MRILYVFALFLVTGCHSEEGSTALDNPKATIKPAGQQPDRKMADLSIILARKEVPVLCYHNIRNFRPGESDRMKSYTVTPQAFAEQMKALSDSGYQTVLPGQLYDYLLYGGTLPAKPIMISFDDTDAEQYSVGATEMNKYGFKGVYFVMTISINRPRYMKEAEIRNLSDSGHSISSHTWDHHMVTKYTGADWDSQFVKPKLRLEKITGKPVEYFAYPFGLWNKEAITELKSRGYKLAFILSTKRDSTEPLYTIRRMIVPGTWSTPGMMKAIRTTFNK
jgi:peptidoglycan/xylan/chitin deacetylase (PgdA/CDA1 family)